MEISHHHHEKICSFHFLSRNRNRSPALSILCTAIQHGKMPQVGIGTKILECLYSLKVRWQRPLSVPFLFCTSGKGTDNITKFHMCSHWVWQPCEVMPFCKHIDDTRKSDSFNQVNELKSFGRKFQWNQGEKVWQKRNHRETWDNTCYLKIIAEDLGKHL